MIRRFGARAAIVAALLVAAPLAAAQTKIRIGCTATTDCASALIAKDSGLFAKHGIDAEMVLIGLNSNIPAALMSGSIEIGGPTPSVFLQAVDGGLELVGVAGASVTAKSTADAVAVVARAGSSIKSAQDFVGKKVGAPGLGAFLHVLFRQWLIEKGVDPKKVDFVEVGFPTMADVLKGGTVEAVVTAEPVMSRILGGGVGTVVAHFLADLPEGQPAIFYAASKTWADKNPKAIEAFRAAIREGATIVNADPEAGRAAVSRFTKIPMEVMKNIKLSRSDAGLTSAQIAWWVGVMTKQDMLQGKIDPAKVLAP